MQYWHEIVEKYDSPKEVYDERKEGKYLQSIAVILLMYFAMGKSYPTGIANIFNSIDELNIPGIRYLSYATKLSSLLIRMEKDGLLIRVPDIKHPKRRCYELNPMIISSPASQLDDPGRGNREDSFEIPLDTVKIFLSRLKESDIRAEIESWARIKTYDFLTFIIFLQRKAKDWDALDEREGTSINTVVDKKSGKKMSDLLEDYVFELKKASGPIKDLRKELNASMHSLKMRPLFLRKDTREP